MPKPTGIKTIFKISFRIPQVSISMIEPARSVNINGVINGANSVLTEDTVTERATSPFARNVMTLLATPLGQHPTKIIPTAKTGGRPRILVSAKATNGMIR